MYHLFKPSLHIIEIIIPTLYLTTTYNQTEKESGYYLAKIADFGLSQYLNDGEPTSKILHLPWASPVRVYIYIYINTNININRVSLYPSTIIYLYILLVVPQRICT